jgi:transcriptional regulator GlxA family with amidase domain
MITDKIAFRAPGATIKSILDELEVVRASGRPINSVTDRVGISHKSVIATFKDHIGVTPLRFVHHHAVLNSLAVLQEGIIPIAQIALDNGFYDQSHFNRVFKSFMIISPGRYRQSYLEGKFCPITG